MSLSLRSSTSIAWSGGRIAGIELDKVHFGPDPKGLGGFEIATAVAKGAPSVGELKQLHKSRLSGRDTSLVVAVVHGETVWMFGPDAALQPLKQPKDGATRHLQAALDEGDSLQATKRFLSLSDAQSQTQMPGVRNKGLFATYHLRENTKRRADWPEYQSNSARIIHSRSRQLIEELGFVVSETANHTLVLNDSADTTRAVALLLDESESFENESPRFHSSPVAWGLSIAAERGVPWLIMLRKEQIRLYPARDGVGVGQKGQTETYLELDLAGLGEDYMGLLTLVFSAEALGEKGSAQELLDESVRYATALGTRLRERIYDRVVPNLAKAVALEMRTLGTELDVMGLQDAYRTTLRILFRFLFQAYAEDRGLLPAGRNNLFDEHSLTLFASQAVERDEEYGQGTGLWEMLQQVWEAIDVGNEQWRVPAYNGGLFGSDPELRPYGALIKKLSLPDSVIGPALEALLIDQTEDQVTGMVDFRSLSVREFGTIYEGLLESSLSLADSDLTLDANGTWLPAGPRDIIEAKSGEPYFHNTSGERKATGSYFTPDFIVDHLIERSIDPSLDDHLSRIKSLIDDGKDNEAAKKFFDYRVADLAMGSAHFLVAVVDRIESKMRSFLAQPGNEIAGVSNELERLAEAARKALGDDLVAIDEIDDAVLLRRQIARRCVYGLDINPLAVELARLALWIHTFVPGLPMSSLDRNLCMGDGLLGFATITEFQSFVDPSSDRGDPTLFTSELEEFVRGVFLRLQDVLDSDEATLAQARTNERLYRATEEEASEIGLLFDAAFFARAGQIEHPPVVSKEWSVLVEHRVSELRESFRPFHLALRFPEVFMRENPGFDVILGNPPWEKVEADIRQYLTRRFPGYRTLNRTEQESAKENFSDRYPLLAQEFAQDRRLRETYRSLIEAAGYAGFATDHPDLYKAFAWRAFGLTREQGVWALVLPRSVLSGRAMADFRFSAMLESNDAQIVTAVNSKGWVFAEVHPQKDFAFLSARKASSKDSTVQKGFVSIMGPFFDLTSFRSAKEWVRLDESVLGEGYTFPYVRGQEELALLQKFGESSSYQHSPLFMKSVYELDMTKDKGLFLDVGAEGLPVYKGASFDLFQPETGVIYARSEAESLRRYLWDKVSKSQRRNESPFHLGVWAEDNLPFDHPRIAYRWTTNATNSRTMICAVVPERTVLTNGCPYLVPHLESNMILAVAAIFSSVPFDWLTRRFVEGTMRQTILNALPFPEVDNRAMIALSRIYRERVLCSDPLQRLNLEAELDSIVAELYGLERSDLEVLYGSFHRGWDYASRLTRVLEFYDQWKAKT